MKPYSRNRSLGKICLPIVAETMAKAISLAQKAAPLADLLEWRLDYLPNPRLPLLLKEVRKPYIVTYRRVEEGGRYKGKEERRLAILKQAVELGADFVDLELRSGKTTIQEIMADRQRTRLILSVHNIHKTPSAKELGNLLKEMMRYGVEVVKIVTLARSLEDNLKILPLIPLARGKKQDIVAFCMGDKGKMSRIFAPLMGAAWTYAALDQRRTSAPGQLTVGELRQVWEKLR